jgi:hypothetical protein
MAERRTSISQHIAAPAQRVWQLLADIGAWGDWNPTIVAIEGESRPGTTVNLVSTLAPKRTFKLSVDEVAPPERMVWSDGMPFGLFTGTRTYTVEPSDGTNGEGCTFHMVEEYTGPLAGLITRSIPDMNESFQQFADGLRAAAEASS